MRLPGRGENNRKIERDTASERRKVESYTCKNWEEWLRHAAQADKIRLGQKLHSGTVAMIQLHKQVTNLRGIIVSIIVIFLGGAAIVIGLSLDSAFWKEVIKELGATMFGIGILAFLWELFTKRAFREETLSATNIAASIDKAGVECIELAYLDAKWKDLLAGAEQLDIYFTYGASWRGAYTVQLTELAKRKYINIRVILPDPDCEEAIKELSRRFQYAESKTIDRIRECIVSFQDLQKECHSTSSLEIRTTKITPCFAMYLFGNKAVFTTYRHKPAKHIIPTLIVKRDGTLYGFLEAEFEHLWSISSAVPDLKIPDNSIADG